MTVESSTKPIESDAVKGARQLSQIQVQGLCGLLTGQFLQCLQVESGFTVDAIQRIELRIWLDDDFSRGTVVIRRFHRACLSLSDHLYRVFS